MKTWLVCCAAAIAALTSTEALAQADVGLSGIGLLSIQPVDDAYVGSPYLSEGIGGFAPGFGAGLSVIASGGFAVAAEFSTARFEQTQSGRLVGGGFPNEIVPHTTQLHDSLLSGLIGYARTTRTTRLLLLGGLSARLDDPTIDGEPRTGEESTDYDSFPVVLTGGVDVVHVLSGRAALVIGGRYSYIDRKENHRYLGIGPHVLRIGAGIRVRLN